MIVYRSSQDHRNVRSLITHLCRSLDAVRGVTPDRHDRVRDVLLAAGELEAGVVDACAATEDHISSTERALRRLTCAAATMFRDSWLGVDALAPAVHLTYQALQALGAHTLPKSVRTSTPEGYAQYHLYPEGYLVTSRALAQETSLERRDVCVVGLRSIGTSLSAVVAAGLEDGGRIVRSWTVRPRGPVFSRTIALRTSLRAAWGAYRSALWLVVDEGPGISGSSLAAAARAIADVGVPTNRIVLMPHWHPEPRHFTEATAAVWRSHRVLASPAECAWHPAAYFRDRWGATDIADISAGAWRRRLFNRRGPAVVGSHERRKWLILAEGRDLVVKFAGFGRSAALRWHIAQASAEAGFGPALSFAEHGLIAHVRTGGRPLHYAHIGTAHIERAADYLAWRATLKPAADAIDWPALEAMAVHNVEALLGDAEAGCVRRFFDAHRRRLEQRAPCSVDGRLQPHEWLLGADGVLTKTDGAEHGDDHFFPGPADRAWDVAALIAEWRLGDDAQDLVVRRVLRGTRDPDIDWMARTYLVPYLAFRAGYASMAINATTAEDTVRWMDVTARYRRQLRAAIRRLSRLPPRAQV